MQITVTQVMVPVNQYSIQMSQEEIQALRNRLENLCEDISVEDQEKVCDLLNEIRMTFASEE